MPGENAPVVLRLFPLCDVTVVVRDHAGAPAPEAVVLMRHLGRDRGNDDGVTDEHGVVRFPPCPAPESAAIEAEDPRTLARAHETVMLVPGALRVELRLAPPPPQGAVEVAFVDRDGRPVEVRAVVKLSHTLDGEYESAEAPIATVRFAPIPAGPCELRVDLAGEEWGPTDRAGFEFDLAPGETARFPVVLEREGTLRGLVRAGGREVEGAETRVRELAGARRYLSVEEPAFAIRTRGDVEIEACAQGFARWRGRAHVPSGGETFIAIELEEGAVIRVRARRADGRPPDTDALAWPVLGPEDVRRNTLFDGETSFRVDASAREYMVAVGPVVKRVEVAPGAEAMVEIEVPDDAVPADEEEEAGPDARVQVRVVDHDGSPAPGARLTVRPPGAEPWEMVVEGDTSWISLAPAPHALSVKREDRAEGPRVVFEPSLERGNHVTVALGEPLDAWIAGRIRGELPAPSSPHDGDVIVIARRAGADAPPFRTSRIAPDGRFRLGPLVDGVTYEVSVEREDLESDRPRVTARAGEEVLVELVVRSRATAVLEVAGEGISLAQLLQGGEVAWGKTSPPPGAPVVIRAPPGRYDLEVLFQGDGERRFAAPVELVEGQTTRVEARRTAGSASVRGFIALPRAPGEEPTIRLVGRSFRRGLGANTPFLARDLAAGRYEIRAGARVVAAFALGEGEERDLGEVRVAWE